MFRETSCIVCGCTDSQACPGGCYWLEGIEDRCSQCEGKPIPQTISRPILFKTEMVQAILADRKIDTRRTKGLEFFNEDPDSWSAQWVPDLKQRHWLFQKKGTHPGSRQFIQIKCPYGVEGNRLWVKETWNTWGVPNEREFYMYKASSPEPYDTLWKPSIFMPRAASRILLEITNIRAIRLWDMDNLDAINEGVMILGDDFLKKAFPDYIKQRDYERPEYVRPPIGPQPIERFYALWDMINKKTYPVALNPFVWAISFKKVKP